MLCVFCDLFQFEGETRAEAKPEWKIDAVMLVVSVVFHFIFVCFHHVHVYIYNSRSFVLGKKITKIRT